MDKLTACRVSEDMLLPKIVLMYPIHAKSTSKQINFELQPLISKSKAGLNAVPPLLHGTVLQKLIDHGQLPPSSGANPKLFGLPARFLGQSIQPIASLEPPLWRFRSALPCQQ